MCKAPKVPKPKEPKKPMFLKNRYLDEFIGDSAAVKSLKAGRNSLRIPLGSNTPSQNVTPRTNTPPAVTPTVPRPQPIGPRRGRRGDLR